MCVFVCVCTGVCCVKFVSTPWISQFSEFLSPTSATPYPSLSFSTHKLLVLMTLSLLLLYKKEIESFAFSMTAVDCEMIRNNFTQFFRHLKVIWIFACVFI